MSTIEMGWCHLRGCLASTCSLPKMYDRKLPPSWLISHQPPSSPPALVVEGLLPAKGARLLLLELPWPLKGALHQTIGRATPLKRLGNLKIHKRGCLILHTPHSHCSEIYSLWHYKWSRYFLVQCGHSYILIFYAYAFCFHAKQEPVAK